MFQEVKCSNNRVYCTEDFEKLIKNVMKRDKRSFKKVLSWIERLAGRFPNKPEMWERIKRCSDIELFELKPKPYRVAVLVRDNICLCVYLWKVEKNKGSRKDSEIEKACKKAMEVYYEFVRFVEGI